MGQFAHQNAVGLICQETRHTDILPETGMTEIGRMQAQQKETQINQKTVIAIAPQAPEPQSRPTWQTGHSQHKQRGSSSHLNRCHIGRTDNPTGQANTDITKGCWHGRLRPPKILFFHLSPHIVFNNTQ